MAERRLTFVTIEEVLNQVPEIDDGQDPLLILRQRKNEKGCHTRAVTKIRNHIAGHGSSHALQALHHNSQSLFLSAASFNNALLKMATTNDEYERYTDWGNKHLSSQVDIEGEIADYLQAISEEVEYVQHNQSQRTTTRQRLVSSTPQHFGHVDQATSISQLEEGMAGFQLDADTHNLQRTHMQPYNQQDPFSIDETGNANARQRLSFVRETADTGHDPVITSNSFLYSETAQQNTSRQPPRRPNTGDATGYDPVGPGVIPRRHPFPWMLARNHRVDESNFTGHAPLQTDLPAHPVWGRPYTLTTTRQNIQPVVENHDGPVNHPNQPTRRSLEEQRYVQDHVASNQLPLPAKSVSSSSKRFVVDGRTTHQLQEYAGSLPVPTNTDRIPAKLRHHETQAKEWFEFPLGRGRTNPERVDFEHFGQFKPNNPTSQREVEDLIEFETPQRPQFVLESRQPRHHLGETNTQRDFSRPNALDERAFLTRPGAPTAPSYVNHGENQSNNFRQHRLGPSHRTAVTFTQPLFTSDNDEQWPRNARSTPYLKETTNHPPGRTTLGPDPSWTNVHPERDSADERRMSSSFMYSGNHLHHPQHSMMGPTFEVKLDFMRSNNKTL